MIEKNIELKNKYKVVIIGAGPAGLRCAKILAELGEDHIVLEKKPAFDRKVCTGMWGLTEKTSYMGISDQLFERKFKTIIFTTPKRRIRVSAAEPFVATLNRQKLSEWMHSEATKVGANIFLDGHVEIIADSYVVVRGKKITYDYLIGADGSASLVRKYLNIPEHAGTAVQYWVPREYPDMEIHFDAARFGPWPMWVAPRRGTTSIGAGGDPRILPILTIENNLKQWCAAYGHDISQAHFEGAAINHDFRGYRFGKVFLIGDAAGFSSGFTGEGIYFAMASGEDVAKIIHDPNHNPALIKKVLRIKKKHELIVKIFLHSKTLEKIIYNLILSLLRYHWFAKRAIELVA